MGLATFKGGIHPYEGKELSENKPIQVLLPKGELVFPMSQHIGAPAKPLVAKGDRVLAGQKIGEDLNKQTLQLQINARLFVAKWEQQLPSYT